LASVAELKLKHCADLQAASTTASALHTWHQCCHSGRHVTDDIPSNITYSWDWKHVTLLHAVWCLLQLSVKQNTAVMRQSSHCQAVRLGCFINDVLHVINSIRDRHEGVMLTATWHTRSTLCH